MTNFDIMFAHQFMEEQAIRQQRAKAYNHEQDFRNNLLPYQKSIYNYLKTFNVSNEMIKAFLSSSDNFILNHYYELCGEASDGYELHGVGPLGQKIADEMKRKGKFEYGANTCEIERCIRIATVYMNKNKSLYTREIFPYLNHLLGR